jgi:DNA-binding response OmpR family regulator
MFTSRQKLRTATPSPEISSILVVSPHPEDVTCLRHILHHPNWHINLSTSRAQAALLLATQTPSVIICERDLPDGTWKDLLQRTQGMAHPPLLLVVSRHADENLWAEVLNLGGYDVLLKPFDRAEVVRVVGMAWRNWMGSFHGAALPAPSTPQYA